MAAVVAEPRVRSRQKGSELGYTPRVSREADIAALLDAPMGQREGVRDWTVGPAKLAAVALLGAASLVALGWSVLGSGQARPVLRAAEGENADRRKAASAEAPLGSPKPGGAEPPASPALGRRININSATAAELEVLPGIGPALAQRIIDDRAASGPFASLDHLDRVKGIGPRTIDKLRPLASAE